MKSFYFGCLLLGFARLAFSKNFTPKIIQANMKEHGWNGPIPIDTKTGLLHPPVGMNLGSAEKLTIWGPHANLYCKILDSGSIFHHRYYKDLCHKVENGKKVDLCCDGYTCRSYGLGGGHMCDKLKKGPRCYRCKSSLCKPHKLCSNEPMKN